MPTRERRVMPPPLGIGGNVENDMRKPNHQDPEPGGLGAAIRSCMVGIDTTGEFEVRGSFRCPAESVLFRGHFPDNPVLPGIHIIKMCLVLLEEESGVPVRLLEIVQAKFLNFVRPGEEIEHSLSLSEPGDGADRTVRVAVKRGDDRIAQLRILVRIESEKSGDPE